LFIRLFLEPRLLLTLRTIPPPISFFRASKIEVDRFPNTTVFPSSRELQPDL